MAGGRIVSVGRFAELSRDGGAETVDLGDVILLPGLINAHCHLDYTGFARQIPPPSSFTGWIQQLITLKAGWSYTDYAASWLCGMHQLADYGTTTVGDIEAVPELLPEVLSAALIRVVSFRELISVRSRHAVPRQVEEALRELDALSPGVHGLGLSPHAPYSTTQELVRLAAGACRHRGWRWTMHVSESREEMEMFLDGRGVMHEWLRGQRDMRDCGGRTPVGWLAETGTLGPDLLLVHGNLIGPDEARLLGERRVSVVHCPRSHDYFGHPEFPLGVLENAGVNVCLGTDSLLSVRAPRGTLPVLSLFAEMQRFAAAHPGLGPDTILRKVTVQPAAALGIPGLTGTLAPGTLADLITVPFAGALSEVPEAIVHHEGVVCDGMVGGAWIRGGECS